MSYIWLVCKSGIEISFLQYTFHFHWLILATFIELENNSVHPGFLSFAHVDLHLEWDQRRAGKNNYSLSRKQIFLRMVSTGILSGRCLLVNRKNIHVKAVASSENSVESFTERNRIHWNLRAIHSTLFCNEAVMKMYVKPV